MSPDFSVLSPSFVIEEHNLGVLFTLDVDALTHAIHVGWVLVWVHVDHLSVTSVTEKESLVGAGVHLEVG